MIRYIFVLAVSFTLLAVAGCESSKPKGGAKKDRPKVEIENPEGDTSVSAEDGGPGFTGEGWETSDPGPIGDPNAVKGGSMLSHIPAWPDNLRQYGIRSNTWLNYLVRDLCYESLLGIDPRTLEFIPGLATHWKISDDKMKFTFRINPRAHWSDGKPVTSDDVIATYRLLNDDSLLAPMSKDMICNKMNEPVAKSKYIVEVECKVKDWRNFISMSGMILLPAHEIGYIEGKQYLDDYNFKYTAVTGPYIIYQDDIKTNESITLTRRDDYWGRNLAANTGLYNFDRIRFVVIREDRLAFDKACKGELDFYNVNTAKWWVEDLPQLDAVKNGHLVRRKVYTKFPKGYQGHAINMRKPPLDDVRVRKALAHLYDRKTMLEKFAYNEYEPLSSYFPGSDAANPDSVLVEFNPMRAAALLSEAGWTKRGTDGILVKDGKRLSITLTYRSQFFEKYLTVFQEAAKGAGVELELQLLDPETAWNNMQDRSFTMSGINWGAILFPSPKSNWHSSMADQKGSNNFVGFKSDVADKLIEQYDAEFDLAKRTELLRQLDAEIFKHHPYVLDWYLPCERVIYWNKFGMPDTVLLKYHEWEDAFALWWVDEEKEEKLKAAKDSGDKMPIPQEIVNRGISRQAPNSSDTVLSDELPPDSASADTDDCLLYSTLPAYHTDHRRGHRDRVHDHAAGPGRAA